MQENANSLISKFVPNFVTQGIIDHDYTMLAMRRFAEISSYFWTSIIRKVKSRNLKIIEELSQFQKTELKRYKDIRKSFEIAQTKYDYMLSKYMGLSKNKEPSALREDAFQLAEARTSYFKISFQLADILSMVQSKLDSCLVRSLADPWILPPAEFNHSDPVFQKVSVEMTRLKFWAKAVQKDHKPFLKQLSSSGKEIELQAIQKFQPSRDLTEYTPAKSTLSRFVPDSTEGRKIQDEKHGWVFVKSVSKTRVTWVRRWIFVKSSMFGWLNISPSKTFVQESDKVGVLLCHFMPVTSEDRRFCFEIKTKDHTFVVQAESQFELISWLQVYEDSKSVAVNSGRQSKITFAFQRIPPPLSDFASTTSASVDLELHDKALESPTSQPNEFTSRSLFSDDTTNSLREIMNLGESLNRNNENKAKVDFITTGPFGSNLVSSPIINSPMPTSKSLEAILANSLIDTTTLPTAITANYWGSINWIVYQDKKSNASTENAPLQKSETDNTEDKLSDHHLPLEHRKSNVQLFVSRYPDYYPLELRAQDAQLRAIFQSIIADDDYDRVVLVFRCLAKPNHNYEVTSRVFVTPTHMCLYSHSSGFTITAICKLTDIISVESRQALNGDTIYFIGKRGTTSCHVFLDSGRLLQKRLLFLIDNANSKNRLGLQDIINKLNFIGTEKHEDQLDQLLLIDKTSSTTMEEIQYAQEAGQRYETHLRQYYDREDTKPPLKSNSSSLEPQSSDASLRRPSKNTNYLVMSDSEYKDNIYSELTQSMSQLSGESDFDIPAKALFHVMFGENSDVFLYNYSGLINRDNFEVTPWKLVGSSRMEREIYHHIASTNSFSGEIQDRVMNIQRVERMNDRCYIVYERRAIWTLPQASFYTTKRYVILKTSKNSCKLSIWSSVEWLRSSIIKNMTEPYLLSKLKAEAKIIIHRALKARQQLGSRGSTVTAIRMFGKLGASFDDKSFDPKPFVRSTTVITENSTNNQIVLSQKSAIVSLLEIGASLIISILGDALLVSQRAFKALWQGILSNRLILFGLLCSLLFNLFLLGKSTREYWDVRFANKAIDSFELLPLSSTLLKRSISLSDLDDLIRNGTSFSSLPHHSGEWQGTFISKDYPKIWTSDDENDPMRTSLCYNRFRTLALETPNFDENFVEKNPHLLDEFPNALGSSSELVATVRNRIHGFRSKLGIARNQLIIELRTLNRIEKELVMAEWQTWLFDEVSMCSRFWELLAVSKKGYLENEENEVSGDIKKKNHKHFSSLDEKPVNVRKALAHYCASCTAENRALKNLNVFESGV